MSFLTFIPHVKFKENVLRFIVIDHGASILKPLVMEILYEKLRIC